MPSFQFVGQYLGRSSNVGAVRYVNLFPHITQDQRVVVFGCPGLTQLGTLGGNPCRGLHVMGGILYALSGNGLYALNDTFTPSLVGTIGSVAGVVSMADNGQQLIIVDGVSGYVYTPSTGVMAQITAEGWPVASSVCFLDGYFIVNQSGKNFFNFSTLYDGLAWDALDYNAAEAAPDAVVAVASIFGFLYVFGSETLEIWYDAGDALTVFRRADGMLSNTGLLAPKSVAKVGDTGTLLCWLATSPQGSGYAVANAGGATMVRISTPEVEYAWAQYPVLSDARAFGYTIEGHIFYQITFPSANATWVYDFTTKQWHERQTGQNRHLAECYAFFANRHVVGSYLDGKLYEVRMDKYDDAGQAIQRELVSPTLGDDDTGLVSYQSFQVDMERGVGLASGQGQIPEVMLSWSSDGGHSWCDEITGGIGAQGVYDLRVIFRRLGRSFRRTWKIRVSDPVKVVFLNAVVKTE